MYNRNAAYDFGTLEKKNIVKKEKILELPGKSSRRKENLKNQKAILTGLFSSFLVVSLGISGFIMGQAKLTEVTDKYSKASKQLEECKSANTGLEMKLKEICENSETSGFLKNDSIEVVKVHKGDVAKIS